MQRTFTLQRLFINLTVLCAVLGIIVAFPQVSVWCLLQAALFAPAAAICWFLPYLSRCPRTTFGLALVGTIAGAVLSPSILANLDGPPSWWDLYQLNFETFTTSTAVGALLFGVIALIFCRNFVRLEKTPLSNRDVR